MPSGVYMTGEDRLGADLRGMAAAVHNLEPVLERHARRTAERITGVPHGRSGRLATGIKAPRNRKVTRDSFEIGPGTFYGHMVFRGTSHSAAQPPTLPNGIGAGAAREIGAYIVRHRHGGHV